MSKKRILYMSVHEILEYDEVKLFHEMGHEVYSLGAYTQPGGQENRKRPPLPDLPYNPHFVELAMQYPKERLHPEQLDGIDIVIIMHDTKLVTNNWHLFEPFIRKGGRVIWRSIGQSVPDRERELSHARRHGLEVVRYSPAEKTIKDNIGEDAMIRFYKDPDEYQGWTGEDPIAINFSQDLKRRGEFCGFSALVAMSRGFHHKFYGPMNENLGAHWGGMLNNEEQLERYRTARVYMYHGTYPASYTLTIMEAMMTGIPVVSVGPRLGNGPMFTQQETFEVPEIIENGVSGFVSDNIGELRDHIDHLLKDKERARVISMYGRKRAIELFGKHKIRSEWEKYLG